MAEYFTLPDTTAKIKIADLTELSQRDHYSCNFSVVDLKDDVISGQDFAVSNFAVPSTETNKGLYIARHLQTYVTPDGFQWLAAATANPL